MYTSYSIPYHKFWTFKLFAYLLLGFYDYSFSKIPTHLSVLLIFLQFGDKKLF